MIEHLRRISHKLPPRLWQRLQEMDAYLVGGAVRDILLDREPTDLDVLIMGSKADELGKLAADLADDHELPLVPLDPERGTYRLVGDGWQLDLTAPRGADLEADLRGRDFTVNAMAISLDGANLYDPTGGEGDLASRQLRLASETALADDPLRSLRVFRVAAEANLDFEETMVWVRQQGSAITEVAPERISQELWALLQVPQAYPYVRGLADSGLLDRIVPDFEPVREVPANAFHHLPLLDHTLELIRQYENVVRDGELSPLCRSRIQARPYGDALVKMACLLHDIRKPQTWQIQSDGRHTFRGHEEAGGDFTLALAERLAWSRSRSQTVATLVHHHLKPFQIAAIGQTPTDKSMRRLFRRLGEDFPMLLALAWSDMLSTSGPSVTKAMREASSERLRYLDEGYCRYLQQEEQEPALLHGDELKAAIDEAELPPTKLINELLTDLRDMQLAGELRDVTAARRWFVEEGRRRQRSQ